MTFDELKNKAQRVKEFDIREVHADIVNLTDLSDREKRSIRLCGIVDEESMVSGEELLDVLKTWEKYHR